MWTTGLAQPAPAIVTHCGMPPMVTKLSSRAVQAGALLSDIEYDDTLLVDYVKGVGYR